MKVSVVLGLLFVVLASARLPPRFHAPPIPSDADTKGKPGLKNCTEMFFEQKLDHFNWGPTPNNVTTFQQRYFVCRKEKWTPNSTIFFYTGNECDVELFVTTVGLMWDNAEDFDALLVFAEHRYFGKSLPYPTHMPKAPEINYLTTNQALEDYAVLVANLKSNMNSEASAVIGFGGSYGGMLCAWMRYKYPFALDGCIAGSAPVANFEDMTPPYDPNAFQEVVSYDATKAGGAPEHCAANFHAATESAISQSKTASGRDTIRRAMRLCDPVRSGDGVYNVLDYVSNALGMMAMSSYPFPSKYMLLGGAGELPAYPMRLGCQYLSAPNMTEFSLLQGIADLAGVYYNCTGGLQCFNINESPNNQTVYTDYLWGYLACTSMLMPYGQGGGKKDMFYNSPWDLKASIESCKATYGVSPSVAHVKYEYGGRLIGADATNIVFSNGGLDPWHPGGILKASNPTIKTVLIPDVGHHIDLLFPSKHDSEAVKQARLMEKAEMKKWVAEKRRQTQL